MIALVWLYLVGIATAAYGVVGFVREIVRVAPDNPSPHYAWWMIAGLTALALVRMMHIINSNILQAHEKETSYILGARDILYAEIRDNKRSDE